MRLIDADLIQYEPMLSARGNGMYEDVMVAYKSQIDDLPTIERKRGKWHREVLGSTSGYGTTVMYQCSNCESMAIIPHSFCPNCGADMKVGEHG